MAGSRAGKWTNYGIDGIYQGRVRKNNNYGYFGYLAMLSLNS